MLDEGRDLVHNFVQGFTKIHAVDTLIARTAAISAFIGSYSILTVEDRMVTLSALLSLIKDISTERFEDGTDFVSFLLEKLEERKIREERG